MNAQYSDTDKLNGLSCIKDNIRVHGYETARETSPEQVALISFISRGEYIIYGCMPTIRGSSPQEFAIATNYIVLLCLCGPPADLIKCLNFSSPVPMLKLSNDADLEVSHRILGYTFSCLYMLKILIVL